MSKLAIEYQGYLKFIQRARCEIESWFGPYCNYDPNKITFMASREWKVMSGEERKNFKKPSDERSSPYLCYLLYKRFMNLPKIMNDLDKNLDKNLPLINQTNSLSIFDKRAQKLNSMGWRSLSDEERQEFKGLKTSDLRIDHIIQARNYLHSRYNPKDLAILEYIIKTNPIKHLEARSWFFKLESLSLNDSSAIEKWKNLAPEEKRFYDVCAELDKKRYVFEKNLRLTKLLTLDIDRDDLDLPEFESQRALSNVEVLRSIVGPDKNLLPAVATKKSPSPFSLFLKDNAARIAQSIDLTKSKTNEDKFIETIRTAGILFKNLNEDEKKIYKDKSSALNQARMPKDDADAPNEFSDISAVIFKSRESFDGPVKPHQLISRRVPNAINLYGRLNRIPIKDRIKSWDALSPVERSNYENKHKVLSDKLIKERSELDEKLTQIDQLFDGARELEKIKLRLYLIRNKNK